ncbi:MAG: poly-gamma-glutamate hydrolase family protein [Elusimicrobiota bacterium]
MKLLPALLLSALFAAPAAAAPARADAPCTPECRSWAELVSVFNEGTDWSVSVEDRRSSFTVFAPHGGALEPGTSELARVLAGGDWNLYLFESLRQGRSRRIHLTSAKYDEPRALELAARSRRAVSVHGSRDAGEKACLGGSSAALRERAAMGLRAAGFEVEEPCRRLPGKTPANLVNRAREGGLQLELPRLLLERLAKDAAAREKFRAAVRSALTDPAP